MKTNDRWGNRIFLANYLKQAKNIYEITKRRENAIRKQIIQAYYMDAIRKLYKHEEFNLIAEENKRIWSYWVFRIIKQDFINQKFMIVFL